MDSFIWIAHCKKTNALHSNVKHHLSHWQSVAIFHKFHSGWHYANRVCQHLINFDGKKIKFSMSMISSISEAQWAGQLIISWESCLGWAGAGSRWLGWLWCLMGGRWKDLTPGPAPPSLCPHPALIHPSPRSSHPSGSGWAPLAIVCGSSGDSSEGSRPARGQPPLQHHAPCLLVNCSENWICLLGLNCLG